MGEAAEALEHDDAEVEEIERYASLWERIAAVINQLLPDGAFVVGEQAEKVRAYLEEHDPDLLRAWEAELSLRALSESLGDVLRARRNNDRRRLRKTTTAEKIKDAVDNGHMTPFAQKIHIGKKVWKRQGDLTADDCEYLASNATARERYWKVERAFWQQVKRRVLPGKTIEQSMSETAFLQLRKQIETR